MADDWDLFAVVRSCTNSTATASTAEASTSSTSTRANNRELGDPFVNLPSFQHNDNPFYFPGAIDNKDDSFQGLEEIYKELYSDTRQSPNSSCSVTGEFQNQPKIQTPQQQVQQHVQPQQVVQSQNEYLPLRHSLLGSSLSFPSTSPQSARPRRRKNQQTKVIHQMNQEELSSDSWAWRKYGQKPIKGSPHPRNYYRCSTSKGCPARKQVERCPTDPNIFVVCYSGEHTHPRPTHRSSLAGNTRSKLSPAAKPTSSSAPTSTAAPITSSATPPIMEGESEGEENNTDEGPYIENDNVEVSGNIEEEEGNDGDDILIPNSFITDDISKGFQELSRGGTKGSDSSGNIADQSSCSLLSPPWTPTSSTATGC